jgi:hypothetical protein
MTEDDPRPALSRVVGAPLGLLALALVGLAFLGTLPLAIGVAVGLAGPFLGAGLRFARAPGLRTTAPIPPLASLGLLAATAVPAAVPALVGGASALVLLLWLADEPDRLPGGPRRAVERLLVPALGLAIAWSSSFLLPGGIAPLGVGVVLLVAVLVLVAVLLRAPGVLSAEATASS